MTIESATTAGNQQPKLFWATATLASAGFPDLRLHYRATLFLSQRAARPGDGIAQACGNPADAKATYRFLENIRVRPSHIWDPLHEHRAKGLAAHQRVLLIHDGTVLMFPRLKATTGLGTADQNQEQCLHMRSSLATLPNGQVIGLLHNHVWSRPCEQFKKSENRKKLPFEQKESYEWVRAADRADELRKRFSPKTRFTHIIDCEGEVHEVLEHLLVQDDDFIIRSCQDRKVTGPWGHLRATLAAQPLLKQAVIEVPRQQGKPRRLAQIEIRSAQVTLDPPAIYARRRPITINAVWVHEVGPPAQIEEPLDWLLLTTWPVATIEDCQKVIEAYKRRWLIEDFHLTLKSGCQIEKTQLKTAQRIEVLLAFLCAVAARVLALRQWARTEPDVPCTMALSEDEWRVAWMRINQRSVPADLPIPTMFEAVRMIGRLGGHLGRKSDGMPGVRSLWKGWCELQILVEGYQLNRYT